MVVDLAAAVGVASAIGLLVVGGAVAGRYDGPGAAWFAAYTVLVGTGLGLVSVAVLVGVVPVTDFGGRVGQWLALVWILPAGLWGAFVLRYTGRFVPLTLGTGTLVAVPPLLVLAQVLLSGVSAVPGEVLGLFGLVARYYALTLVVGGTVLVVRATRRYAHVTARQGYALALAPVAMWLFWNTMPYIARLGRAAGGAAYATGAVGAACGLGLAVFRFDAFRVAPTVGVVGERDVLDETEDLVVIADDEHRVVRANGRVRTVLDGPDPDAGATVVDVFGHDVDGLRAAETVALDVGGGPAKYDPQVSTVSDRHDRHLGVVISLREVTERELRKERLAVLNRILRHNLRNRLDVVDAHLETVDDDRVDAAMAATDELARTSARARIIDRLLSETREPVAVDVAAVVREAVAARDPSVTVEAPDSLSVTTDRAALEAAVGSALDNAVTHATDVTVSVGATEDGCAVRVDDDGPGIPDSELAALEAGTEGPLQHGTGLGLWQLTWATRALGDRVSFDTSDGTTVTIPVPDAAPVDGSATTA